MKVIITKDVYNSPDDEIPMLVKGEIFEARESDIIGAEYDLLCEHNQTIPVTSREAKEIS